ncbi:glycerol-3-phosphate acyltransferase, chloroplastic [Andrographis paniculata]|uniref:glycerol-3-phosphate acyltransferase, chloroplastic n=1 Tax=Andrographis paniculata TaxID=175694 RepID=UPI0021E8EA99|nr:glycerol-3-phosphate acyltransferase, chloroplastic [Andrographis paniculata]XP_051137110.1 glycerol-3-phosphate acyltransferase, chloroplastic [Andrographis paniculata]XP_051137112.1 glycerol-3-phosphate acyltransferase, chloroplastic [Andrographis paniculata]
MILSTSASASTAIFAYSRVSPAPTISYSLRSVGRVARCSSLLFFAPNLRGTAKALDGNKSSFSTTAAAAAAVVDSDSVSASDHGDVSPVQTFLDARTEQDLLLLIQKETEAGKLPAHIAQGMEELYYNYRNAVVYSGHPKAKEVIISNMAIALDRIFMDVLDPFQFSPYHEAIRAPFDYYMFGQKYIRPLIDFRNSFLGNLPLFNEMETKLQQGENVILISNHQTEADPAVIALLLESTHPFIAENMIYVAGDRVVTDPLCKPFSMGRNLLCVYSKKHMNDDPKLTDMKKRANTKSLKEMAMLLRGGSKIIWIAPSGGRDRPDSVTKEWYPAPFDASSVDNMRRLAEHADVPSHIYPLAILCYDIMPPPLQVEKEIGEKRVISFHGVGLSAAPEISYRDVTAAFKGSEEAKIAYSNALYSSTCEQYNILKSAIYDHQSLQASTSAISLSQPWL